MKLKQGIIEEKDIPKEEPQPKKEYTLREKISNFIYLNKLYIVIGTAAALFLGFIIYDMATRVVPDTVILYIADDPQMKDYTDKAGEIFSGFCEDFNGDRKVVADVYYLPAEGDEEACSEPRSYDGRQDKADSRVPDGRRYNGDRGQGVLRPARTDGRCIQGYDGDIPR